MSPLKARVASITVSTTSIPKHIRDASICSSLTDDLREQYGRRSIRVIKGDTVKIMRGEYTGIEGKVEKVNTMRGTLSIEGVQREKVRGGNVKVQIHASNVRVSALNVDDKYRQNNILAQIPEQAATQKDEAKDKEEDEGKNKIKKKEKKRQNKNKNKNKGNKAPNKKTSSGSTS